MWLVTETYYLDTNIFLNLVLCDLLMTPSETGKQNSIFVDFMSSKVRDIRICPDPNPPLYHTHVNLGAIELHFPLIIYH